MRIPAIHAPRARTTQSVDRLRLSRTPHYNVPSLCSGNTRVGDRVKRSRSWSRRPRHKIGTHFPWEGSAIGKILTRVVFAWPSGGNNDGRRTDWAARRDTVNCNESRHRRSINGTSDEAKLLRADRIARETPNPSWCHRQHASDIRLADRDRRAYWYLWPIREKNSCVLK